MISVLNCAAIANCSDFNMLVEEGYECEEVSKTFNHGCFEMPCDDICNELKISFLFHDVMNCNQFVPTCEPWLILLNVVSVRKIFDVFIDVGP